MSDNVTIYALRDPRTNRIRYIGATGAPKSRASSHNCPPQDAPTFEWVQELRSIGLRPCFSVLEVCSRSIWRDREMFWIASMPTPANPLLNTSIGGNGNVTERDFEIVNIRVDSDVASCIDMLAERLNIDRNGLIESAVSDFLSKH